MGGTTGIIETYLTVADVAERLKVNDRPFAACFRANPEYW